MADQRPHKGWTYTLHEPTHEDENRIHLWDVSRQIYGHETAPTTGQHHLQGFVSFRAAKRFTGVTRLLPRAHWEVAKYPSSAWDYCTKGDDLYVVDNRVGRGTRSDWQDVLDLVSEGASDAAILRAQPSCFFKYGAGISRARAALQEPRHHQTLCEWYYGPTGGGKSTYIAQEHPEADWCQITKSGFLLGYHNKPTVVFDDPDLDAFGRELFLNLVNRTPFEMNVKGTSVAFNAKLVIVASNKHPDCFIPGDAAVHRRIHKTFLVSCIDGEHMVEQQ
nr:replication-associated protein [Avon-Heathcote Estuary associated circular virus 16]